MIKFISLIFGLNFIDMSLTLPDNLFPAVLFLPNNTVTKPIIFTVLIYNTNQGTQYVAWFHEHNLKSVTVYKNDNQWKEKHTETETEISRAIGLAIENYNPY